MGFPQYGICPTNYAHCIYFKAKRFITDASLSCDECNISFHKIYHNGSLLNPHYYTCKQCDIFICFKCAKLSNLSNKDWNTYCLPQVASWQLPKLLAPECSKPKLDIDRLKASDIFNNMNNNILTICVKKIIQLFGGNKAILQFIIKNSTKQKLNEIHNILINQLDDIKINTNALESMPKECMIHIIGYLKAPDVNQFKLCSRKIGIICLEEMKKIPIPTINGNNMLNNAIIDPYNLKSFITTTRYSDKKLFRSLYRIWSQKYNINENNLLIFRYKHHTNRFAKQPIELVPIPNKEQKRFAEQTIKQIQLFNVMSDKLSNIYKFFNAYLILDKTKTVCVEKSFIQNGVVISRVLNEEIKLKYYKLIILRYFDVVRQTVKTVQYILFRDGVTVYDLFQYIENRFIEIDGVNNQWYYELKHIIKQMNNVINQSKLAMY
eukprot:349527_1